MSQKTRPLCEGAVMVALALILGMLRLYRLPDGGSITIAILPLTFFALRYGPGWGFLAGFAFGYCPKGDGQAMVSPKSGNL